MADKVWKKVSPYFSMRYRQLLLKRFFDLSTPFMRKVDNGGEKEKQAEAEVVPSSSLVEVGVEIEVGINVIESGE